MGGKLLRIGLATARFPSSAAEAVGRVLSFISEAADQEVALLCFPECYLPGMRGVDFDVPPPDQRVQADALEAVRAAAARAGVAVILPMEWDSGDGLQNVAWVIGRDGALLGMQTKNQLPLEEEPYFVAGSTRRIFEIDGVPFGVVICHEGWRYPETVRWAARRSAKIVFHPHFAGSAQARTPPPAWGSPGMPIYEKAMAVRAAENSIYFASVNFALPNQEAGSAVIGPAGECLAAAPYGVESLLTWDVDPELASGLLASRFQPGRYEEVDGSRG
jgi:predicted amidohydrolase